MPLNMKSFRPVKDLQPVDFDERRGWSAACLSDCLPVCLCSMEECRLKLDRAVNYIRGGIWSRSASSQNSDKSFLAEMQQPVSLHAVCLFVRLSICLSYLLLADLIYTWLWSLAVTGSCLICDTRYFLTSSHSVDVSFRLWHFSDFRDCSLLLRRRGWLGRESQCCSLVTDISKTVIFQNKKKKIPIALSIASKSMLLLITNCEVKLK